MQVSIRDRDALLAISPAALSAYARATGWSQRASYRERSDIYISDALPEIVVPRTTRLGDYASVVAELIETFARVSRQDELTVYHSLVTADRDVIRVQTPERNHGGLPLDDGLRLFEGVRDMVLSTTRSLRGPRPAYRERANRETTELLRQMRFGPASRGGLAVTLLTPAIPSSLPSPVEDPEDPDAPDARRMTRRLVEALDAARRVTERASGAPARKTPSKMSLPGELSANFCEALVKMIEPFATLDVGIEWARTRPMTPPRSIFRFGRPDAAMLHEVARAFRKRAPRFDARLHGFVHVLARADEDAGGKIKLKTKMDGRELMVTADLERTDYERAIQAREGAMVTLKGDLERTGQKWKLLNPRVESVLRDDGRESENGWRGRH